MDTLTLLAHILALPVSLDGSRIDWENECVWGPDFTQAPMRRRPLRVEIIPGTRMSLKIERL